jgi:NTP pyrophosphatase (non-canonical NTP hydrolase)
MFNKLTDQQMERLFLLAEELGEVQQAIGKILRHGYESHHPDDINDSPVTNRQMLEKELGDVMCAIDFLCRGGDLDVTKMTLRSIVKAETVQQYLHHHADIPF